PPGRVFWPLRHAFGWAGAAAAAASAEAGQATRVMPKTPANASPVERTGATSPPRRPAIQELKKTAG
ncbi:MAG: hypothetical protein NT154_03320, partial [Verrucomicrobia bacterium]|nr:hypothetical protein [Verrucomicrobiota bacterium]